MNTKLFYAVMAVLAICMPSKIHAQFNTICKDTNNYILVEPLRENENERVVPVRKKKTKQHIQNVDTFRNIEGSEFRRIREKYSRRRRSKNYINTIPSTKTEGLTLESLYQEILKNNIKYPKIVLAQAVLETGWFKSSVCRNKGNLFGLVNPRTKTYYEFDDWRDSVTAYRDKVQYRYKSGNYLLWLKKIGYAEDKGYIEAVMRVMKSLKVV